MNKVKKMSKNVIKRLVLFNATANYKATLADEKTYPNKTTRTNQKRD